MRWPERRCWVCDGVELRTLVLADAEAWTAERVAERAGFVLDGPAEPWEYSETGDMLRYLLDGRTL